MISDEERSRVAKALREPSNLLDLHASLYDALDMRPEVVETTMLYQFTVYNNVRLLNRLADLIDRPTCHNASGCDDVFKCSECGAEFEPIAVNGNEYGDVFYTPLKPLYCSACGAEVVDEPASRAVTQQR